MTDPITPPTGPQTMNNNDRANYIRSIADSDEIAGMKSDIARLTAERDAVLERVRALEADSRRDGGQIVNLLNELDTIRAQLAQAHTISDSYAVELKEEPLERALIAWAADEKNILHLDEGRGWVCVLCDASEELSLRPNNKVEHLSDCLHILAKAHLAANAADGAGEAMP